MKEERVLKSFILPKTLDSKLSEKSQELGFTKSKLVRTLLWKGLGERNGEFQNRREYVRLSLGVSHSKFNWALSSLPKREIQALNLYFEGNSQREISRKIGISQPSVCYRLKKANENLRAIISIPSIKPSTIKRRLKGFLGSQDIKVMVFMYQTSSQTDVAKKLRWSQGKVRSRFLTNLEIMRKCDRLSDLVEIFDLIREKPHLRGYRLKK